MARVPPGRTRVRVRAVDRVRRVDRTRGAVAQGAPAGPERHRSVVAGINRGSRPTLRRRRRRVQGEVPRQLPSRFHRRGRRARAEDTAGR